ncbi:MAG: fumarylacetoacetate hydrolase family protein [Defluviicoccus sp.]|nr:fumarylacetoacetate hydrolase family protein [Defluviicoccus sp.]
MKYCRYNDNRIGVVRDDRVHDVTSVVDALPAHRYPFPIGDALVANLDSLRGEMERLADAAEGVPVSSVTFLSPVANPTKVIGVPVNYQAHADEAKADAEVSVAARRGGIEEQGLFLKANSALVGPSEGVAVRFPDRRTDHEAELGIVIGRAACDVGYDEALDYVAGYAIALDMVVRGTEDRSMRKSVDTYAVLGPWLTTADEIPNPDSMAFELTVNGETRQKSNTELMIMDCRRQIEWASSFYTLHPGDIIMSGTCEGVSRVLPGDTMHLEFAGLGAMDVPIRAHG